MFFKHDSMAYLISKCLTLIKSHSANSPVVQTSTPASVRHCERCLPGHSEHPSTRCRDVYVSTVQNVVGTVEKPRVSLFVRGMSTTLVKVCFFREEAIFAHVKFVSHRWMT